MCKPWREPSSATKLARTLFLDLQPPELWENKLLLFNPLIYGILLMAVEDEYNVDCKKKKKKKKQNTNLEFYIQCNYPLSVEEYFII